MIYIILVIIGIWALLALAHWFLSNVVLHGDTTDNLKQKVQTGMYYTPGETEPVDDLQNPPYQVRK